MAKNTYRVSHSITVIYTRIIEARTCVEAEEIANIKGDFRASADVIRETKWKAKLIKRAIAKAEGKEAQNNAKVG